MTGVFDAMTGERIQTTITNQKTGENFPVTLHGTNKLGTDEVPTTDGTTNEVPTTDQTSSSTNEEFMTVTYWEDAAHGWLEVTATQLKEVGLKPSDLSDFSYLKYLSKPYGPAGLIAYYLEEDCDLPKFMVAHSNKFGTMPRILEKYHPFSPVRNYSRIRGTV